MVTTPVRQIAVQHFRLKYQEKSPDCLYRPSMASVYPTLLPQTLGITQNFAVQREKREKGYSNSLIFKSWYKSFNKGSTHDNGPKDINMLPGNRTLIYSGHSLPLATTFFEPHVLQWVTIWGLWHQSFPGLQTDVINMMVLSTPKSSPAQPWTPGRQGASYPPSSL